MRPGLIKDADVFAVPDVYADTGIVGHPPGAPLFQMLGAFFAMFALSADKIALMVNYLSAFSSAFTVLFMFWSLTILLKKDEKTILI